MKQLLLLFLKREKSFINKSQLISESLLAILIFLIVFVGFYNLMYNYLRNLNSANKRIIANFLALEGLELVRAIRNYRYAINECRNTIDQSNNYSFCPEYTSSTWLNELGDDNASTTVCLNYDFSTTTCDSNRDNLYLNNGFYSHNPSGSLTKFKRLITIEAEGIIETATSVKVTSRVEWENNEVILQSIIYNFDKIQSIRRRGQ